ncbi:hypothetical protein N7539_001555 [Penicillium diatomitis]|uniref:Mucin-7 n=1 Tax=Penicillium diatomitis TaxID=2819901 RepID=A0A9W9XH64_9EURO|nr:uncharacterized protein N7539_001555 [Penicillium diatomitis]KAJ5492809.1 hypothetical protein N7539_001555 [Penicillium diatomitis]
MSDNNGHPGVRSLLAKFENSQSPITSPPSRGRSPVGSDTSSSTRQLSKVRASFVTVEGVLQSSPGSPLRKTSGPSDRSDSPGFFGPTINAKEIESRRQNNAISPTPGHTDRSLTSMLNDGENDRSEMKNAVDTNRKEASNGHVTETSAENAAAVLSESTRHNQPPAEKMAPSKSDEKDKAKPPHKRSTSVQNNQDAGKSSTQPTTTASQRSAATQGGAKPQSARELAKERANGLAHKPSRVSLATAPRTTTRPTTRGVTPSADTRKTTTAKPVTNTTRSPTRSTRLTNSTSTHSLASNSKGGSSGIAPGHAEKTASSLTRKPSILKSAAGPAATVRRQASRASLPAQHAIERPSSRVSEAGTKPVNEGFLARMMRPTASSASKTHDKSEAKAPPTRLAAAAKPPRQPLARASERSTQPSKAKAPLPKQHGEKAQVPRKDRSVKREQPKTIETQESEKDTAQDVPAPATEDDSVAQLQDTINEEPEEAVSAGAVKASTGDNTQGDDSEQSPAIVEQLEKSTVDPSVTSTADKEPEISIAGVAISAPQEARGIDAAFETESQIQDTAPDTVNRVETSEPPVEAGSVKSDSLAPITEPAESLATEATTVTETSQIMTIEPESEELEQAVASESISDDRRAEDLVDIVSTQPSEVIERPKESIPVETSDELSKSDADEIDFATLALS